MSKIKSKLSRRDYLKMSMLSTGALVLPGFANSQALFASKSRLNIALIGGGGIARSCYRDCMDENVVAIADVDDVSGEKGFEAFPKAKKYKDFRKMLDAHHKELDLVIVNTPDHTHFVATYAAMELGIAVHTQKPLTHNIWEARTLQKAAKKFKVQTVMGNQGHNYEGMRLIKDWYDAGICGEIKEVHAWTNRTSNNTANGKLSYPAQPVPESLDWNLWQGPAKERPYNKAFCPKNWRWHWDYGSGALGDIGCHTLDIPIYTLGLGYPSVVYMNESLDFRKEFDGKDPNQEAATVIFEFPAVGNKPAVKVYWYEGGRMPKLPASVHAFSPEMKDELKNGCLMVGEKNTILSPGLRPSDPILLKNWEEIKDNPPERTTTRPVGNPVQEIKAAVRGDISKCGSDFEYAAFLTEVVLLGTIAIRTNKIVIYDPETMTFSDSSLNKYIGEPIRKGWEYGKGLIPAAAVAKHKSQSLFNGKDLSGWTYKDSDPFTGKKASSDKRFSVNDGALVVNPGEGIQKIWTTEEFGEDFILKLEFRASVKADSGIYLRGPQLQCRDYLVAGPYKDLKKYKPQDWNQIEVVVKGQTAICTCNGEILSFDKTLPAKGPIGLEADYNQMEYRNIQIITSM